MKINETHSDLEKINHIPDIDIDVANRDLLLRIIPHTQASIIDNNKIKKHNVGIYLQNIPKDNLTDLSSIDYKEAEDRGYVKFDILNLDIYKDLTNSDIDRYMSYEPNWELLNYKSIVEKLFHISDHYDIVKSIRPSNLEELAIVIALKMPGKRYLLDKDIEYIKKNIWKKESGIYFKKSHSIAYAQIIWIQLNHLVDMSNKKVAEN